MEMVAVLILAVVSLRAAGYGIAPNSPKNIQRGILQQHDGFGVDDAQIAGHPSCAITGAVPSGVGASSCSDPGVSGHIHHTNLVYGSSAI